MSKTNVTYKTLTGCARCTGTHHDLTFQPLLQPVEGRFTHWAMCPVVDEPIMLETVETMEDTPPADAKDAALGAALKVLRQVHADECTDDLDNCLTTVDKPGGPDCGCTNYGILAALVLIEKARG